MTRPAVRQLLVFNVSNANLFTHEFPQTSERTAFLADQASNGDGFLNHCKTVAISNALIDSSRQAAFGPRVMLAGDTLVGLDFGLKISLFEGLVTFAAFNMDMRLLTNPNGTGAIMSGGVTYNFFNPATCLLHLLKIRVGSFLPPCNSVFTIPYPNTTAANVKCLDILPGGYIAAWNQLDLHTQTFSLSSLTGLAALPIDFIWSKTDHSLLAGVDVDLIFARADLDITINSSAPNFCFIPQFSALDYRPPVGVAPDHDIMHDNIDTTMHRVRCDLIVGYWRDTIDTPHYPSVENFLDVNNAPHQNYRNDNIGTNNETWINREIGDKEMHLDNHWLNRPALFEAHDSVTAGIRESKYYLYEGRTTYARLGSGGLISKDSGFIVDSAGGDVTFKSQGEIRLRNGFEARKGCNFDAVIDSVHECSLTKGQYTSVFPGISQIPDMTNENHDATANMPNDQKGFWLAPNPAASTVTIHCPLEKGAGKILLLNELGQIIRRFDTSKVDNTLDISAILPGLYMVVAETGQRVFWQKLIITHN
jgi:hypothetical protein